MIGRLWRSQLAQKAQYGREPLQRRHVFFRRISSFFSINGEEQGPNSTVPASIILDEAFQRGNGCFEVVRVVNGSCIGLGLHLDRLAASAQAQGMGANVAARTKLIRWIKDAARVTRDTQEGGMVRIVCTRGGSNSGLPRTVITLEAAPAWGDGGACVVAWPAPWHPGRFGRRSWPPDSPPSEGHSGGADLRAPWGIKWLGYGPNMLASALARREAARLGECLANAHGLSGGGLRPLVENSAWQSAVRRAAEAMTADGGARVDALLTECRGNGGAPRAFADAIPSDSALSSGAGAVLDGPTFAVAWSRRAEGGAPGAWEAETPCGASLGLLGSVTAELAAKASRGGEGGLPAIRPAVRSLRSLTEGLLDCAGGSLEKAAAAGALVPLYSSSGVPVAVMGRQTLSPVHESEAGLEVPELVLLSSSKDVLPADILVLPRLSMAAGPETLRRSAIAMGMSELDGIQALPLVLSLSAGSRSWQRALNRAYLVEAGVSQATPNPPRGQA